jgi:hypothetical protein
MRKLPVFVTFFLLLVVLIVSCGKTGAALQEPVDCSTVINKNFATDINPIVQSTCNQQGCHDVASINGPGPLTNYSQVFNARLVIRGAIESGLMPQNSTLSKNQRNAIICWIDGGAPNN